MVREIPMDKIVLGSNSPFCNISEQSPQYKYIKTHFKSKPLKKYNPEAMRETDKFQDTVLDDRNEPCKLVQLIEILANLKGLAVSDVAN